MFSVHRNKVNFGERLPRTRRSRPNLADLHIMKRSQEIEWQIVSLLTKSPWSVDPAHGTQFCSPVFASNLMFRNQLHCNSLDMYYFKLLFRSRYIPVSTFHTFLCIRIINRYTIALPPVPRPTPYIHLQQIHTLTTLK
jgi:hypothetical protein